MFGNTIEEWSSNISASKFGFQGQEAENELYGAGNASFFKYRISDNRLGRFFAIDPLAAEYPHNSPYAFSENRVTDGVELEGKEVVSIHGDGRLSALLTVSTSAGVMFDAEGAAAFVTPGAGGGYVLGGGLSIGVSYSSALRIEFLSGWGGSMGATFSTPLGGAELTGNFSGNFNGATLSLGRGGAEAGLFGEANYSFISNKVSYSDIASTYNKLTGSNASASDVFNFYKSSAIKALDAQIGVFNNVIETSKGTIDYNNQMMGWYQKQIDRIKGSGAPEYKYMHLEDKIANLKIVNSKEQSIINSKQTNIKTLNADKENVSNLQMTK